MKDRQLCQSEAEARLSSGSAIAVPAITISLKKAASRLPGSIDAKSPNRTFDLGSWSGPRNHGLQFTV